MEVENLCDTRDIHRRSYVIAGGTDGIGRGLALHLLGRGDRVVAIASGAEKGQRFLASATSIGAADRAHFVRADLSTLTGMRAAVVEVGAWTSTLDGLVFGAQRFQPTRVETGDGLEFTFALNYLSRYVLGHELAAQLERATVPVVLSLAGSGGLPGKIRWDDLQFVRDYRGRRAAMQASRCNDLLAVAYPARHPGTNVRYVLFNPGFVRTAMADPLPTAQRVLTKGLATVFARSVEETVPSLVELLDGPPAAPVSAWFRNRRVPLTGRDFDPPRAMRLDTVTAELLARARSS
ncbi:SDR family NAD(P)-dependent oxidoreductase [Nocardia shimofusensis]|uniref:SDR family NAD(P)-dependent oxidoreductase n=1 Tax=Nocardia shimofusensis TaxID=228596 RepID=UPI0009FC254E|nr:SDR family NAD(P)-dependent oxidoreductase [Nocardia shimofusensis]